MAPSDSIGTTIEALYGTPCAATIKVREPDDVWRRTGRQISVPRQQLLVHRPRHIGQDARPIHNCPPAPTLDDVVTGLVENCTGTPNEPLAEAG